MKTLAIACAFVLLFTVKGTAGEMPVSTSTLSSMGLGSMQQMSDDDGIAVRGKAVSAGVWGTSSATWGGQSSSNSYFAGSSWLGNQGSSATGNSFSFGGNFQFRQFSGF